MAKIKGTNKSGESITGFGSDDHIVALGGNDTIDGGAGNDHINAGAGDDHVTGGEGNDLLHGNGGADVFHYTFNLTSGSGGGNTVLFTGGFNPGADNELSQTEFSHQYDAWLVSLGADMNNDDVIDVVNNGGSPTLDPTVEGFDGTFAEKDSVTVHVGNNTQPRYYSASATTAGGGDSVTSADGHDTIADFHVGLDRLALSGLNQAQFLALFEMDDSTDVNGDGVADTVISISGDSSFSITLLGVNGYALEDFYGA